MPTPLPFRDRLVLRGRAVRRRLVRRRLGVPVRQSVPRWRVVRVAGESMAPTLRPGDLLLLHLGATPGAGDLVVADLPGGRGPGVKRAVRLEPEGWWLERDSPAAGADSWLFGAVAVPDVHGVVRARLWPRPGRLRRGR